MKKPKFEVGDRVNLKRRPNLEHNILTITDVDTEFECYTCNQGSVFGFNEQDKWKLVERPEKNNMEKPNKIWMSPAGVLYKGERQSEEDTEYVRPDFLIEGACKWLKENITYTHPCKGTEECIINLAMFKDYLKGLCGIN